MTLFQAIKKKDIDEINRLIKSEKNILKKSKVNNNNSLHSAVSCLDYDSKIVYILLRKANELLSRRDFDYINSQNNKGKTPLSLACQYASDWSGYEETIKLLIYYGADLNIQD